MSGRAAHRAATYVLCTAMVVIGLGLIVEGVTGNSSGVLGRTLLGALFIAAGLARSYLEVKRGRGA